MKNKFKPILRIAAITALAAVITFLMVSCSEAESNPGDDPGNPPGTTPTVASVTVSPSTASVAKGGSQTFSASVAGTKSPAQTVTWSIVQTGKNAGTTIDSSGVLSVAAAETLTSLTVKATSTVDTSKSGTAAVTVSSSTATVASVTVSPSTASVAKGGSQTFSASVTGTNSPAQTVTWSIVQTGKNAGTTINASGKLTVAAAETLTSLTVRATSTVDTSKSGTATVTVTGGSTPPTPNPITGNIGNWNYGYKENGVDRNYQQAVWTFTNTANLKSAEKLVLVLNTTPNAGMDFVWQDTATYGWNSTAILSSSGSAQNGAAWDAATKTLTITLAAALKNYASNFTAQAGGIQIVVAYYGSDNVNNLGIVSANLVDPEIDIPDGSGAVTFAHYWVNEQDELATAGGSTTISIDGGGSVVFTASGTGYSNQQWFVDGVEDTAKAGQASFTFSSAGKETKKYIVSLLVEKGGKYYEAGFTVTVTQ